MGGGVICRKWKQRARAVVIGLRARGLCSRRQRWQREGAWKTASRNETGAATKVSCRCKLIMTFEGAGGVQHSCRSDKHAAAQGMVLQNLFHKTIPVQVLRGSPPTTGTSAKCQNVGQKVTKCKHIRVRTGWECMISHCDEL